MLPPALTRRQLTTSRAARTIAGSLLLPGAKVRRKILDIQQAGLESLVPLLLAEEDEWRSSLHWERRAFTESVRRLARRGRLAGWLLLAEGEPVAKAMAGAQGGAFSIELPYVLPAHRGDGHLEHLLDAATAHLLADRGMRRIEVAFFPFGEARPSAVLRRRGFGLLPRQYMAASLHQGPAAGTPPRRMPFGLEGWTAGVARLARLLVATYREEPDRHASEFYTSEAGCLGYLEALTRRDDCGNFAADLSAVGRDSRGEVAGFLLATRIDAETAHVAQIAVTPGRQGEGLGRALLDRYHARARAAGLRYSTLLVTGANERALAWYGRRGYRRIADFDAYWRSGPAPAAM